MPTTDLKSIQTKLKRNRENFQKAQLDFLTATASLNKVQQALDQSNRYLNLRDKEQIRMRDELLKRKEKLAKEISKSLNDKANYSGADINMGGEFFVKPDPIAQIEKLSDDLPVLLMPLRLETRFKTVGAQPQLWLRIFPDECFVDTFEPLMSEHELQQIKYFWTDWFKAGGFEAGQQAAWRALVASFGSGRSSWLYNKYKPLNISSAPLKANEADVILTIPFQQPADASLMKAASAFWKEWRMLEGDSAKEQDLISKLKKDVGDKVANNILEKLVPVNLTDPIRKDPGNVLVKVDVAFVEFPPDENIATSPTSWTKAATVQMLPDYFVVIGYNGAIQSLFKTTKYVPSVLSVSPDPSLPQADQMRRGTNGDLDVNKEIQWLTDFDKAIEVGMGLKIDLTSTQYALGFEKLVVVGLRLSADAIDNADALKDLLEKHFYSKKGFSLLPQGAPTNNTDDASAGFTRLDNADESYKTFIQNKAAFTVETDNYKKKDGQWFGEFLGFDMPLLQKVPFAGHTDQTDARAMNTALWPCTLGYFMDEMMDTVFTDEDIKATRNFYTQYVSARGCIPAIRIGKQPYGILPAMRYSFLNFNDNARTIIVNPKVPSSKYTNKLRAVLWQLDKVWEDLVSKVSYVGKTGPGIDPHQVLLDVVGLHPSSVEFHQRYFQSKEQLYNQMQLSFSGAIAGLISDAIRDVGMKLLASWGVNTNNEIPIVKNLFLGKEHPLTGSVIDNAPLSETDAVAVIDAVKNNYLGWLSTAGIEDVRTENFAGGTSPSALLYLFLRQAIMEQSVEMSLELKKEKGLIQNVRVAKKEPVFLHVTQVSNGQSKLVHLVEPASTITNSATMSLGTYIDLNISTAPFKNYYLRSMKDAIYQLKDKPTAQLERLFTEHIDTCSYRLDSWKLGLVHLRLEEQRKQWRQNTILAEPSNWSKGIHLGALGYLENVKSEQKQLTPVKLDPELGAIFNGKAQSPLVTDSTNAGFIHAPSLNHAATAAILRNAYISNNDSNNKDQSKNPFSVNLSSERVRLAMNLLEGVRNGQPLGALLGYRFERGLHDKSSLGVTEINLFIYPLRLAFPLVAENMVETEAADATSIEQIEARNVIDGLKFINHISKTGKKNYPFGLPVGTGKGQLPAATPAQANAIEVEVEALFNVNDAVADLVMAESVYQVVLGNFEKAAANTDAVSKGGYPPETEIVRTPRSGITLTHRTAIHFDSAIPPVNNASPRAEAEPGINKWLGDVLPPLSSIAVHTVYSTDNYFTKEEIVVTAADLGLLPIDLLYILNTQAEQSMNELDDAITQFVFASKGPQLSASIKIEYTRTIGNKVTFFELTPLVNSLRSLVVQSKPVTPRDVSLPTAATVSTAIVDYEELKLRIQTAANRIINTLLPATAAVIGDASSNIDDYGSSLQSVLNKGALFGLPQTGTGFIGDRQRSVYNSLRKKLDLVISRWAQKETEFNSVMAAYPSLTTDEEKFSLLLKAERAIRATRDESIDPSPASPALLKVQVDNWFADFLNKKNSQLSQFKNPASQKLSSFITSVKSFVENEYPKYDLAWFDSDNLRNTVDTEIDLVAQVRIEFKEKADAFKKDIDARLLKFQKLLSDSVIEKSADGKVKLLQEASKLVLGEEFRMLPRYQLSDTGISEFSNAYGSGSAMIDLLKNPPLNKFAPLDDWLYGVARVREKMQHYENVVLLSEGLAPGTPLSLALTPVQLPFKPNDQWLGLEFSNEYKIDSDKLLYTAHFANGYMPSGWQSGVLVDEWTEVIPAKEETTGITFHYDQPNTEPPQAWLLVTPSVQSGSWKWDDFIGAIHETISMAKKRAVDPRLIDQTTYAQLLPATMMAVTLYLITVSTNLAINNNIYKKIKE